MNAEKVILWGTLTILIATTCHGAQTIKPQQMDAKQPANIQQSSSPGRFKTKPANILVLLPAPAYSHTINCMPIFEELARRGHKITMVSPFPKKEPFPNWENIEVENFQEKLLASLGDTDLTKMNGFFSKTFGMVFLGFTFMNMIAEQEPIQALARDTTRKFDLVFVEAQFAQEPLVAFAHKYNAKLINLYPTFYTPEFGYYTGNPILTTNYVPSASFAFSDQMTFSERAVNTANSLLKLLAYNLYYIPKMDTFMRQMFPIPDLPYLGDMLFNASFTLTDSSATLSYPYPRVNNVREYMGVNTKKKTEIPPELKEVLETSKEGILYFTLGSTFKTSTLRPHVLSSLLSAFGRVPQKVFMKWDLPTPPPNKPANVITASWFPQSSILSHKNCRVFLTHAGAHGFAEAMDHGVPVVTIPLFADQEFVAKKAESSGVGRIIYIDTVTPDLAYDAIADVINNPKYKENAVKVSKLLQDRPIATLDEAVYWVEYVLRTDGAAHLRPGSLALPWYQRFGLDLAAAAFAISLLILWINLKIICWMFSMCTGKSSKRKVKTN